MMLFNKLLQAVPILSFSVMRICQSGCFRLTLIQASIRRSYPFCSLYLPMLMILFSRQELPFSGEKGKKFGMTQAFFTSFQLSASCCVRTTSASSFFYSLLLFLSPMPCDLLVWESPLFHQMQVTSVWFGYMGFSYFYASIIQLCQKIQFSAQCADDNIRFQGFQPILQLLSVQVHQGKIIISSY